jgi:hypothetical protein
VCGTAPGQHNGPGFSVCPRLAPTHSANEIHPPLVAVLHHPTCPNTAPTSRSAGRFEHPCAGCGDRDQIAAALYSRNDRDISRSYPEAATLQLEPGLVIDAAGMVEAGKQFRRVNGHLHLRTVRAALERHVATENVVANRNNDTVTAA